MRFCEKIIDAFVSDTCFGEFIFLKLGFSKKHILPNIKSQCAFFFGVGSFLYIWPKSEDE